jgi:AraC family transcriptional regulator, melibiose operon regulatory protein
LESDEVKYRYELIDIKESLPLKIIYHTTEERNFIPRHWHEMIELSYVIYGEIDRIYIDGMEFTSRQGDIVLINSNAIHSFSLNDGKGRKALTIFIPLEILKADLSDTTPMTFDCNSILEQDEQRQKHFDELRKILDGIAKAYLDKSDHFASIKLTGLSYELIYLLLKYFKKSGSTSELSHSKKYLERLTLITSFIKDHYHQNLPIDLIAKKFSLSPGYLSRFFLKHMGMTIPHYINSIRLKESYRDLINSDYSIMQIALDHGFPNDKSFNRVFKQAYHQTPNQYRKNYRVAKWIKNN